MPRHASCSPRSILPGGRRPGMTRWPCSARCRRPSWPLSRAIRLSCTGSAKLPANCVRTCPGRAGTSGLPARARGVPLIGVGLLYRHGYFTQSLSPEGWQMERYPSNDPNGLALSLLHDSAGSPTRVTVALDAGRVLAAQIWLAQVGRVPLLLLDSYVEENEPALREVTDRLYGGGSDHRLWQELLLGIGGVRAVRAF